MENVDPTFNRVIGAIKGIQGKLDAEAVKKSNPMPEFNFDNIKFMPTTGESYDGKKYKKSALEMDEIWRVSDPKSDKYYLGVDLGVNGACVVLDNKGEVYEVFNTPDSRSGFLERFKKYEGYKCFCITEKVASMPQNGVKASHTFGVIVERTLYTLELCKIPFQEVTPQTWMKTYMLKKEKGETNTSWKNRLKTKAQQLFPHQKITLATADAFLIAEYARRNY